MKTLSVTQARAELYRLLDEAAASHEAIHILGRRHNAVLINEDDWRSIQETLHLLSVPGMREAIVDGLNTPPEECSPDLDW